MTAISPTAFNTTPATPTTSSSSDTNQVNQDTFLKLLVAQMKYQNPLSPTDSTAFLTQTAQFTTVSTLQDIEKDQKAIQQTNQLLAATGMVGRSVTYSTTGIAPTTATPTSAVSVGGNLAQGAPVGSHVTVDTSAFNNVGTEIPLQLDFTRTADGWTMQAKSKGAAIGPPSNVTFDASGERTSTDVTLSRADLDSIGDSSGTWPRAGLTIKLGSGNDANRVEMGAGTSKLAVLEQNGGNGQSLTGRVTGIRITADGPQLQVDGRDVPLASVTEVQAPAL